MSPIDTACQYCGNGVHGPVACPLVKSVEFFPDGSVKRVEKYDRRPTPTLWPTTSVTGWPQNIRVSVEDAPPLDKEEPH